MAAGLYGAFMIDPPRGQQRFETDRTLVVSEWTADAATGRTRGAMQMEGMFPNFFTINGKSYPDTDQIRVAAGKPVLLRLINAGQFAHPLHLHGTAFRVVARAGHPQRSSELRDTLTLESGGTSGHRVHPARGAGGCSTATSATTSQTTGPGPAGC